MTRSTAVHKAEHVPPPPKTAGFYHWLHILMKDFPIMALWGCVSAAGWQWRDIKAERFHVSVIDLVRTCWFWQRWHMMTAFHLHLCALLLSGPVTPSTLLMPIITVSCRFKRNGYHPPTPPLTISKIQNIGFSCESVSAIMWLFTLLQPPSWIFYSSAHLWVRPDPRSPPQCHILSRCYFPWCCILFLYFLWPQEAVDLFLNVPRGFLLFSRLSLSHVFASFSFLTFLFLCTLRLTLALGL